VASELTLNASEHCPHRTENFIFVLSSSCGLLFAPLLFFFSQFRFLAWDSVDKSTGIVMVGTDIFSIALLTLLPFLNVLVMYPSISLVVVVYWLAWLGQLQSYMYPLSVAIRLFILVLVPSS